ncbi:Glycosyltransferase, GT2 family [Micromonospora phaseoli]|uniref:Glycosyltransferase, GT2 family n=1 Tax=Micromonospora phaseoli TaxID=1144548 RepID=A0A1H6T0T0_9ACTN|nr:glycosyltransferase family 2 protein [Micromonospora phaseoli]PZW04185.1 GT2 family glycosyltransferase [Micromonospora phaseoli]GIJ79371.1 glycosyl transferase family 2 [Micromonospora phaseoli]SEI73698.1 Glycosyltransferase, GT2 family [Micromonospora phaseoli]
MSTAPTPESGDVVAVIVVTYNSAAVVPGLLESLGPGLAGLRWHLTVADNASSDGTAETVRRLMPAARVVETGRNGGYSAGINAAAAAAAPFTSVLILNPDVRLTPGCGQLLLDLLRRGDDGIVVPLVTMADGSPEHTLRREPTVLRALGDALLGAERAGRFPVLGEVVTDPAAYRRESRSDWAVGSALLVSGRCWSACAPWDESFFLYSEETDFALRARDAGFPTRLAPAARATHIGGDSRAAPWLWRLLTLNKVRLYRRRNGRAATAAYWAAVLLREVSRAALGSPTSRAAAAALLRPAALRETPGPPADQRATIGTGLNASA